MPNEVDFVVLLVSEVVTNAVIHAGPHNAGEKIGITVTYADAVARVEVTDCHPGILTMGSGDLEGLGGRGLLLLDAISHAWGVTSVGSGKTVWFEVRA